MTSSDSASASRPSPFATSLSWVLFALISCGFLAILGLYAGIFPLARVGVLPLWSTLGVLAVAAGVLLLLFALVKQGKAYQIAGGLLVALVLTGAAHTAFAYDYNGHQAVDNFVWWSSLALLALFFWHGWREAGAPAWCLVAVAAGGLMIGQGRHVGYTYYEPLIIIAEDVSNEHAVLDQFIERYDEAQSMAGVRDGSAGIGDLYNDGEDNALAMLAEKDALFYEYALATGEKARETKEHLTSYEDNPKDADPSLRDIRNVIILLQKAHEIFEKEEAFFAAQLELETAKSERQGQARVEALASEVNRLRSQVRRLKQGRIDKAQDLLTSPEAAAIIASGGRLYQAGGKKERTVAAEDDADAAEESADSQDEFAANDFAGVVDGADSPEGATQVAEFIPDEAKWLLDPEPYATTQVALSITNDVRRFAAYLAFFAAVMVYLNGWARPLSRWQPLPLASRFIDGFWEKSNGVVVVDDYVETLTDFLYDSNEKGEGWLCFAPKAVVESGHVAMRPQAPFYTWWLLALFGVAMVWSFLAKMAQGPLMLAPALGVLAALTLVAMLTYPWLKRQRRHLESSSDNFVADADAIIESAWHGTYLVSITDQEIARPLFMDLLAALRNRQGPRAVAHRTLNIIWALPQQPPAPMLEELLRLAERQNLRLVLLGAQAALPDVTKRPIVTLPE